MRAGWTRADAGADDDRLEPRHISRKAPCCSNTAPRTSPSIEARAACRAGCIELCDNLALWRHPAVGGRDEQAVGIVHAHEDAEVRDHPPRKGNFDYSREPRDEGHGD